MGRIKFLSALLLLASAGCATRPLEPYLFPRGKQKHAVTTLGPQGDVITQSESFLLLDESQARLTVLSPVALTLLKANFQRGEAPTVIYMNPALSAQKRYVQALLNRLNKLFWARGTPHGVEVQQKFADGSAQRLAWQLARYKILIEVVPL